MKKTKKNVFGVLLVVMLCMIGSLTVWASSASIDAGEYVVLSGTSSQSGSVQTTTSVSRNVDKAYLYTYIDVYDENGYYYNDAAVSAKGVTSHSYQFNIPVTIDTVLQYAIVSHNVQGGSLYDSYSVSTQVGFD